MVSVCGSLEANLARNLITDVPGVLVGNAQDVRLASGVSVVLFDEPAVASIDVRGGGPGTRETDLLDPQMAVQRIDAVTLSGGSAFGLDAPSGAQAYLREQGRGYQVGSARVPIVPGAILFDLFSGGDKNWGRYPPYRELAYAAAANAVADFALGSVGAGTGATTVNLKGGLGSASAVTSDGFTIGALCCRQCRRQRCGRRRAVEPGRRRSSKTANSAGSAFGPRSRPMRSTHAPKARCGLRPRWSGCNRRAFDKAQAARLAVTAQDGLLARATRCTPRLTAMSYSRLRLAQPRRTDLRLHAARRGRRKRGGAPLRAVYEATALPFADVPELARQVYKVALHPNRSAQNGVGSMNGSRR